MSVVCRGVRGATCASENSLEAILGATRELLAAMIEANGMDPSDIASIFFTVSEDIDAAYPAAAARELGLADVAMLCAREIPVPRSPQRCIRVLAHWNTPKPPDAIEHVYMGDAATLRPDRRWPRGHEESSTGG